MKVDFDNVRRHTVEAYESLVDKLNDSIEKSAYGFRSVNIPVEDIRDTMDDLRMALVTIACLEGDEKDIKCIIDEFGDCVDVFDEEE